MIVSVDGRGLWVTVGNALELRIGDRIVLNVAGRENANARVLAVDTVGGHVMIRPWFIFDTVGEWLASALDGWSVRIREWLNDWNPRARSRDAEERQ